jgi:hypothetical protein
MCLRHEREKGELDRRPDSCKHEGSRGLKSVGTDRRTRKPKERKRKKQIGSRRGEMLSNLSQKY